MLSAREAFKVGFLSRCVEEGLSLEEAQQRVKMALDKQAGLADIGKAAIGLPGAAIGAASNVVSSVAKPLLSYGIPFALAAPPIAGGLAGYSLAKITDTDDQDPDEIKKQELVDEYRRQTARLNRERQMREYRDKRKQTGRVFL